MAERRHDGIGPAGLELRVEVHWCLQCRAERTVQIMQLATDPEPIAVCVECGAGVDMWLSADLVDPAPPLQRHGSDERRSGQQGAA
jgi:hypothetical protein